MRYLRRPAISRGVAGSRRPLMSPQQDPELFLCLWLDPFDIFPQHFQPQPLILGCRQFVACNRERVCCVAESCEIASVQIRVGKDCIQLGDPRLQSRDPRRQQVERPAVTEIHSAGKATR